MDQGSKMSTDLSEVISDKREDDDRRIFRGAPCFMASSDHAAVICAVATMLKLCFSTGITRGCFFLLSAQCS